MYLNPITWVRKKNQLQNPKLITIPPQDCNTILQMFDLLGNLDLIVIVDVHVLISIYIYNIDINQKFQDVWALKMP
jgi:hypothetical protein